MNQQFLNQKKLENFGWRHYTYINQIFGKDLSIKYVENDIIENDFIMDYSLATKEIGFIPTIEIQKGLKTHILDFKEKHHEHKK